MFKNIESLNYLEKNKKIVLSLISFGFLTGAAVIDKDVPGQEIADVHKIRPVEKPNIPPYSVVPKDKLSKFKSKNAQKALFYGGWNNVGNISGYNVQYRTFSIGSDDVYQILGTSPGGHQLGFACFCANINTVKTWKGVLSSACDTSNPNVPLKLDHFVMGVYRVFNVNIPDGACCRTVPKVGTTNIPGLPPCG